MPTILIIGLIVLISLLAGALMAFWLKTRHDKVTSFKQVISEFIPELVKLTQEQLGQEKRDLKESLARDFDQHRQSVKEITDTLRKELDERQREIRLLEQDRNRKFGQITESIQEHRKLTEQLKETTEQLTKILNTNQVRGEWGERIIEDLLRSAGLVEQTHYLKQTSLGPSGVIPDIILLLPGDRKVAVDVKFPYQAIQSLVKTQAPRERQLLAQQFKTDVKDKIKQIITRGYINEEEGTLNYAILFVPNELLFSYINQHFPDVVDFAIANRVIMTSPFTFLMVTRTLIEAYKNFMLERNLRKIVAVIGKFVEQWERFQGEFDKFDETINLLRRGFDQISQTRYKQMELRIRQINALRHGQLPPIDQPSLLVGGENRDKTKTAG